MPISRLRLWFAIVLLLLALSHTLAKQCGSHASGATCPHSLCCSRYGYCGSTVAYCSTGCQSGPCTNTHGDGYTPLPSSSAPSPARHGHHKRRHDGRTHRGPCQPSRPKSTVSSIITSSIFDKFFSNRAVSSCPSQGFYTYENFIYAADAYKGFGTTGSLSVQKQELAAFFANIGHETSRGCYVEEIVKGVYCDLSLAPCAPGQEYYGRGPIQLSWNYNYQAAGNVLGFDGVNNPGIVASNGTISFETAVWYWMTQGSPSCHAAMVNSQGFGATINAINGGLECGATANLAEQQDRISLYKSFCSTLGVWPGRNLTC